MAGFYHDGNRRLQDAFDTRRLADRLEEVKVRDVIDAGDRAFIESLDMFFLATADAEGRPTCSYKGGDPGFVRVLDERTLAFPNYDGNGMYLSLGNTSRTRRSGCCSCPSTPAAAAPPGHRRDRRRTTRCSRAGPRRSSSCASMRARCSPTARATSTLRAGRALALRPARGQQTPVPDWKRTDWAADVLPEGTPRGTDQRRGAGARGDAGSARTR